MKRSFKTWFALMTSVIVLLVLLLATYAWFSSNRAVNTSTATARTGDETLELQISSTGGNDFKSEETAPIQQVNQTDSGTLMPVSTADLTNFVCAPVTVSGDAATFRPVENEANYYHGRLYLRAVGEGWQSGSYMNLYLDQSKGLLGQEENGMLLNAARLGLKFDGGSPVILRLSESENQQSQQAYNTVLNGQRLGKNQVLQSQGNDIRAAADPSVPVSDYTVTFDAGSIQIPDQALLRMEFGKIYTVDVYFYLEGCDPDCSDAISFDASNLYLAFYGVLDQGAGG